MAKLSDFGQHGNGLNGERTQHDSGGAACMAHAQASQRDALSKYTLASQHAATNTGANVRRHHPSTHHVDSTGLGLSAPSN